MLLWLLAWWGGWENSFNKGYEQAWVGRTIGLIRVAISLPLLARLPMALVHQAAADRMGAFFAFRDVRRLIRLAGWRYVGLSLLFVLAALPLFVAKGAPVFVEQWSPGFTDRNAVEIEMFARSYRLWATVYLLAALVLLRRARARDCTLGQRWRLPAQRPRLRFCRRSPQSSEACFSALFGSFS